MNCCSSRPTAHVTPAVSAHAMSVLPCLSAIVNNNNCFTNNMCPWCGQQTLRRDLLPLTFPAAGPTKNSTTTINDAASLATIMPCQNVLGRRRRLCGCWVRRRHLQVASRGGAMWQPLVSRIVRPCCSSSSCRLAIILARVAAYCDKWPLCGTGQFLSYALLSLSLVLLAGAGCPGPS